MTVDLSNFAIFPDEVEKVFFQFFCPVRFTHDLRVLKSWMAMSMLKQEAQHVTMIIFCQLMLVQI